MEQSHTQETPVGAPEAAPAVQTQQTPSPSIPPGGSPVTEPPVELIVQEPTQVSTPAPEPEPVSEPTPEPAPEPEPQATAPVDYESPQQQALDAAGEMLSSKGIDPRAVMDELVQGGKLSPEREAELVTALGREQAILLLNTFKTAHKEITRESQQRIDDVYNVVGGKAEWDKIAAWTATPEAGLSDEAAEAYNAMLAAGGVQAQLAANALKEAYMATPGFKEQGTQSIMVQPDAVPAPQSAMETISRRQYVDEKRKAIRTGDAAKVAQLEARAQYTLKHAASQWRLQPLQN